MLRRVTSVAAPIAHLVGPGQLKVVNGRLAYKSQGDGPLRLDPRALRSVYCYGDVSVTGAAFELLFSHNVHTAWFSAAGHRCRGRLAQGDVTTTFTRVRQHRVFADPLCRRDWAKIVVAGKINAASDAARHYQRHGAPLGDLLADLARFASQLENAPDADVVRGLEGAASAAWFAYFKHLFQPPFEFSQRTRRPPTDPVNALLSLGYTFLLNRARAQLEADGFELYIGGLHEYRAGRPSLACDLIEPLRASAVDRWVVAACGQRQFTPRDFVREESGGYRLQRAAFAKAVYLWEDHARRGKLEDDLRAWIVHLTDFLRNHDTSEPDISEPDTSEPSAAPTQPPAESR